LEYVDYLEEEILRLLGAMCQKPIFGVLLKLWVVGESSCLDQLDHDYYMSI
jgi:hypothetical protein